MSSQARSAQVVQKDVAAASRARPQKAAGAFRTISEVADELNVPQHVLRFWETRFFQVRPLKRGGGRRYYRPEDVALIKKIHHLLYAEGYTIKGVQKLLKGVTKSELMKEQGIIPDAPVIEASFMTNDAANQDSPDTDVMETLAARAGLSAAQRSALEDALRELHEIKGLLAA